MFLPGSILASAVSARLLRKPRLLLPNSVYLQSAASSCDGAADGAVLSVANVQAGEPYQLELVHTQQRAELTQRRADETTAAHDLQRGPLRAVCAALAAAARLVHPHSPCIAILSKPLSSLALRTRIDVRGVGERPVQQVEVEVVHLEPPQRREAVSYTHLTLPTKA